MRGYKVLAAVSSASIIASFGIGLGPVPFLLISELFDSDSVGTAQRVGLSLNWVATFIVGLGFPPLQALLGGQSFYLFSIIAKIVPESKGKTVSEVWNIIA